MTDKRKTHKAKSWGDKLNQDEAVSIPVPAVTQDPLASIPAPEKPATITMGHSPEELLDEEMASTLKAREKRFPPRPAPHVIENMVLRRELYLAKAEIITLKLQSLGIKTES